jgi:flagellar protein FliO/FliZ
MEVFQQFAAVAAVIGLLIAALWLLRARPRLGAGLFRRKQSAGMESLGSLSLTAQHSLHLVRVGHKMLVLGLAPSSVTLIRELDSPAELPSEDRP